MISFERQPDGNFLVRGTDAELAEYRAQRAAGDLPCPDCTHQWHRHFGGDVYQDPGCTVPGCRCKRTRATETQGKP